MWLYPKHTPKHTNRTHHHLHRRHKAPHTNVIPSISPTPKHIPRTRRTTQIKRYNIFEEEESPFREIPEDELEDERIRRQINILQEDTNASIETGFYWQYNAVVESIDRVLAPDMPELVAIRNVPTPGCDSNAFRQWWLDLSFLIVSSMEVFTAKSHNYRVLHSMLGQLYDAMMMVIDEGNEQGYELFSGYYIGSCEVLGILHASYIPQNRTCKYWFEEAIKAGSVYAKYALGVLMLQGNALEIYHHAYVGFFVVLMVGNC